MTELISICAVALTAFIFSLTIRQSHPDISLLIVIAASVIIIVYLIDYLTDVVDAVKEMLAGLNIKSDYITILLKCTGICFITEFGSDICREAGCSTLSSQVSLAGKLITLVMAIPLFKEVLSISLSLAGVV